MGEPGQNAGGAPPPEEELLALRLRVAALERDLEGTQAALSERTALLDATYRSRGWRAVERTAALRRALGPAGAVAAGWDGAGPAGVRLPLAGLHARAEGGGPRWRDSIEVGGVRLGGALADPPLVLRYAVDGAAAVAGCVRAFAALRPAAWSHNVGGVRFAVRALGPDGAVLAETVRDVDPAARRGDRRWVPLTLALPAGAVREVVLATEVPPGAEGAYAWAAWGDPVLLVAPAGAAVAPLPPRGAAARAVLRRRRGDAATPAGGEHPLVSLLMPVHDPDPELLRATFASVTGQTSPRWQLCVCDDGSRDERVRAALTEAARDDRVVLARHEAAQGIAAATTAALGLARGAYVATLDHDDVLAPDAIATVATRLAADPSIDVLYSDNDKVAGGARFAPALKPGWSPDLLRSVMYTLHLGVYRRELVERAGGWRPAFDGAQDHDLVLRLSELTDRIVHLPATLYSWRAHAGSAALADSAKPEAAARGAAAVTEHLRRTGVRARAEALPIAGRYRVFHEPGDERVAVVALGDPVPQDADVVVLVAEPCTPAGDGWREELAGPLREPGVAAVSPVVLDADDRVVHAGVALLGGIPLPVHPGAPAAGDAVPDELTIVTNRSAASGVVAVRREAAAALDPSSGPLALVRLTAALARDGGRVLVTPHAPWRLSGPARGTVAPLDALRAFAIEHRELADPLYNPRLWRDRAAHAVPRALEQTGLLGDVAAT